MPNRPSFVTLPSSDFREATERRFILLHRTRPRWIVANRTTLEIARCLDGGESIDETARRLAGRYGISVESARQDVLYVAEELARQQFELGNPAGPRVRFPSLDSVFFHITTRCNLSCLHCYVDCQAGIDLPTPLILRILDEMVDNGCLQATLSGGEPLLHPEIRKILTVAAPRVKLQVLTNGTLIDRDWAAFLAETVSSVQVSIDGSTSTIHDAIRGEGSFERVKRAVECLQEEGLAERIILSATIMKQNLRDLPAIIALAESLGIPNVRFLPLRKFGRAETHWDLVGSELSAGHFEAFFQYAFDLQESRRCSVDVSCGLSGFLLKVPEDGAGDGSWCPVGKRLVIGVDGDIYPCVLLMRDAFRLGNVFQQGLSTVVRSDRMAELCGILLERRTKLEPCSRCEWASLCQAGCMGQAVDHRGTPWDTDLFCDCRKKAYRHAFDRVLQRA